MMKTYLKTLFAGLAVIMTACAPKRPDVPVTDVILSPDSLQIAPGQSAVISVTILPDNATDKTFKASSRDESIATAVAGDGIVTVAAVAEGETAVAVTAGNVVSECKVTVKVPVIPVTSLKLNMEEMSLSEGQTKTLIATKTPDESTESLVWSSDDPAVATVDDKGNVTAVTAGNTIVRVKTSACEASASVNVYGKMVLLRVDPLTRLINNEKYEDDPSEICVARGETASVQIAVEAIDNLSDLDWELVYFGTDGKSTLIEPKCYWQREVTATRHWHGWAGGPPDDEIFADDDKYYDPLMPLDEWNPGAVSAGKRAALLCELNIPRDFTPGIYTGEIKVSAKSSGKDITASRTFTVKVYNVTLPEKQNMNIIQWEGGSYSAMNGGVPAEYHGWPDLQKILIKFMNDYGQNSWRLRYAAKHSMGGGCTADYSTDPPTYKYNFNMAGVGWEREFQLYIDNCPDLRQIHGQQEAVKDSEGHLSIGAYYFDPYDIDAEGHPTFKYGYATALDNSAEAMLVKAGYSEYFRQLGEWLKGHKLADGRTWLDLYVQTITDEPKDPTADDYSEVARLIKAGCPEMKITDAIETNKIDPRYLDYPCPTLGFIENCRAQGNQEQWMYTCISPEGNFANRFLRVSLIKTRIVHWCNYYYDAPNYLHWGLMYWDGCKDPYGDVAGEVGIDTMPGGDCFIIYPGYRKVFPSIRLCAMRDGIHDFDLLKMVEAKGGKALATEYMRKIVKDQSKTYLSDSHRYYFGIPRFRDNRREILEYLEN